MTNSRKELSFSDHTHSGYALTSHTHSNYALTSHTHSGYASSNHTHSQYVSQSTVQSMINNASSTIYYNGNIRSITATVNAWSDKTFTLNITSSTKFVIFLAPSYEMCAFCVKLSDGSWFASGARLRGGVVSYTSTSLSISVQSTTEGSITCYYVIM